MKLPEDLQNAYLDSQKRIKELELEVQNVKKQHDELKTKNEELLEVNGKLFTRISHENPVKKEEEKKEEKANLSSIDDLQRIGVI